MRTARVSRDEMLMDIAQIVAARSTCSRLLVGAVIARQGRVLSTGYNGAPSHMPHCDHTCTCPKVGASGRTIIRLGNAPDHHEIGCPDGPCNNTIHAEANAIVFAAKYGMATDNAELYVTHAPCLICARLIINAGIMGVMYSVDYRDMSGHDLLVAACVPIQRI